MNQTLVVGKVSNFLQEKEKNYIVIQIEGQFPASVKVELKGSLSSEVQKHCNIGSVVGVKGHLTYDFVELGVECEKITFISGVNNAR